MHMNLPENLQRFVQAKVQIGRFASSDEALAEAVRLLQEREDAEDARALAGIRQGLDDMRAGRTEPLVPDPR
jgi:putative addiction module CopG family antidote